MSLKTLWNTVQPEIKEAVGATSYDTWFASLEIAERGPSTLIVETPDDFFKSWIVDHYKDIIESTLQGVSDTPVNVEFSVNSRAVTDAAGSAQPVAKTFPDQSSTVNTNLNSQFTFDNFVIGPANRFACAASQAVAEQPAKAYNPLFIYGSVGLGKTHLIQAITHKLKQCHPNLKYCYMSSERFTNDLIDAIRYRSTAQFRTKCRDADVLLIDDIQFIAGKEATQEEFFHTFNNLHNNHKQIIITSDRPPKEIANLEERLSSRFAWGLIADIQPPDFETRVAILRKKIENDPVDVPDDVIHFIADQIQSNIRELEGALIRVVAYSSIDEKPITLDVAKSILKDMVKEVMRTINIESVQKTVSEFYKVPLSELRGKKRHKSIVLPRQVAMYLSRQLTNFSLPEIGNAFGGKHHTTVLHSCKEIERALLENREDGLKETVRELTTVLKQ